MPDLRLGAIDGLTLGLDDEALDVLAERVAAILEERIGAADPWMGVRDAAVYMGCKPHRVYDLVRTRAIDYGKDGSRVIIKRSALDAYIREQRRRADAKRKS